MTITDQAGGVIPAEIIGKKLSLKTIFLFNIVWILIFAVIYFIIGQSDNQFNHTKKNLNFMDALYFAVTTQTSIGYGDISPRSTIAKIFVMIQQISVMVELVAIISGNLTDETFKNISGTLSKDSSSLKSGIWNPKMSLPSMPSMPKIPGMPSMPKMPGMPSMPKIPGMPSMPKIPGMPSMPSMPSISSITDATLPSVPTSVPSGVAEAVANTSIPPNVTAPPNLTPFKQNLSAQVNAPSTS